MSFKNNPIPLAAAIILAVAGIAPTHAAEPGEA
jgi:hypothetical protein